MKRIYVILFLGQVLIAGLIVIHMQRLKLKEGYQIGKLLEQKEDKLIQLDKQIYLVEKLKNPKSLMKKIAEAGVNERPADEIYFKNVYLSPEERIRKVKEYQDNLNERWKAQLAEIDSPADIED